MASTHHAACTQSLAQLRTALIVERQDLAYTRADHDKALGFRALASAHVEDYVEKLCSDVAKKGADRFLANQPTRTGRALLVWHGTRKKQRWAIPLRSSECIPDRSKVEAAAAAYAASVKATHGISGQDARDLVIPLGVQDADLDEQLFDRMDQLAVSRQQAVHVTVNRVKTMTEPIAEWNSVQQVMAGLLRLDDALLNALENF